MVELLHAKKFTDRFGPGFITGMADDDPSGLATTHKLLPSLVPGCCGLLRLSRHSRSDIQMGSARIGWVTGKGLAANISGVMPRRVAFSLVA
jgi:Mn2+/Fe2+ NRAMP family transporter